VSAVAAKRPEAHVAPPKLVNVEAINYFVKQPLGSVMKNTSNCCSGLSTAVFLYCQLGFTALVKPNDEMASWHNRYAIETKHNVTFCF